MSHAAPDAASPSVDRAKSLRRSSSNSGFRWTAVAQCRRVCLLGLISVKSVIPVSEPVSPSVAHRQSLNLRARPSLHFPVPSVIPVVPLFSTASTSVVQRQLLNRSGRNVTEGNVQRTACPLI